MKIPVLNSSVFSLTALVLLFASFSQWPIATAERPLAQKPDIPPYPTEIKEAYKKLCVQQSTGEGFTPQQATNLCTCVLDQFQARFTLDQFLKIYAESSKTQEPPDEFVEVGLACANQLNL
ncbi:MAG: hypothetical protein HC825_02820 [Oscillatoriales cyanobacterium RM1_1_9]|nr:hypothetical protein [Oscillatoriales cyanobacterium SM2_3_0]NJO47241.1 hypothetical protein [Oscillatoriales cyanobacterium RM2_1_1]NJO70914.1 hypothetical protein [Oscillatoriales cyanobacterium RM1_1_9]